MKGIQYILSKIIEEKFSEPRETDAHPNMKDT